eukprot:NODE_9586_length_1413_cov_3.166407.p1 GENE.NODE_9586_length_1413_cov_3.166407~~NODE_9586_length_1413_cov_3.166407.p1  ORF type:complete len:282 (-),score=99.58 NODE_9586_length_1413_cov_3.166407:108-953(-)
MPQLEVLEAECVLVLPSGEVRALKGSSNSDLTRQVQLQMTSPHELNIPSVRSFLGQAASRTSDSGVEATSSLALTYRIGPEVFHHIFKPSEAVQISAAVPGGTGSDATICGAVEDGRDADAAQSTAPEQLLSRIERALRCQRLLTDALWPKVRHVLIGSLGKNWQAQVNLPRGNLWSQSDAMGEAEPDAEGLLRLLRRYWEQVVGDSGASNELLKPIEALALEWAEQADASDEAIAAAAAAAAALLRACGLEAAAAEEAKLRTIPVSEGTQSFCKPGGGGP